MFCALHLHSKFVSSALANGEKIYIAIRYSKLWLNTTLNEGVNLKHELIGQILGFIMAHSAAIGDSLAEHELMVPYIITINNGKRESIEFEAETQQQAVNAAEKKLSELSLSVEAWSYSQDGLVTLDNGEKQDVFFFKVWTKGMSEPLQAYQMYRKQPFKLIGNIQILNYSESGLLANMQKQFSAGINEGIESHPTGSKKWESWL